jgi:LPXTG-site transpeptidase (sortase) family protein
LRATLHSDGTAEPIDPPHGTAQQWNTAAWIEQSAYPAAPAHGASYIYGHACHYHVCPFSRLADAAVGDAITVQVPAQVLTYRVCARGLSSKDHNLVVPACSRSSADLVLVTCQYEHGDSSTENLVVVASLAAGNQQTR